MGFLDALSVFDVFAKRAEPQEDAAVEHRANPAVFLGYWNWTTQGEEEGDTLAGKYPKAKIRIQTTDGSTVALNRAALNVLMFRLSAALDKAAVVDVQGADGQKFSGLTLGDYFVLKTASMTHPDAGFSDEAIAKFRGEKGIQDSYLGRESSQTAPDLQAN